MIAFATAFLPFVTLKYWLKVKNNWVVAILSLLLGVLILYLFVRAVLIILAYWQGLAARAIYDPL